MIKHNILTQETLIRILSKAYYYTVHFIILCSLLLLFELGVQLLKHGLGVDTLF